ncbi:hypothetical protein [Ruminococcus sp.]|uniref:hypothetical protein n=1 Tax=Ruminococcus sp. TaxID=41978 RepID=UPI0025DF386A|nr:hypothetical protein [Ruminococcus sp.]
MKLNYRDKIILIVVFVILVLVAGFMLFVKPAIDDCSAASDELESAKVTLSDLQDQIDKDKNLAAEIQTLYTSTSQVAANFYDYQTSYRATDKLRELFDTKNVNITNTSMSISAYSSTVLQPYTYASTITYTEFDQKVDQYNGADSSADSAADANAAAASTDANAVTASAQTIGCYTLDVSFNSSLDGFKNFADNLSTNTEKSMVIKTISIDDVNESEISGSMTLQMMVMKKLSDPSAS